MSGVTLKSFEFRREREATWIELETVAEFLAWRFPAAVRRHRWHMLLAAAFLVLGALAGFTITHANPDRFYTFVDADVAQGRGPAASTAELRAVLYDGGGL